MKTANMILICVAVIVASSAACLAEAPGASAEWWGRPPGKRPVVHGRVANVSPTNIAVETKRGVKPFVVTEDTRVMVRGEDATIADVLVGDPVVVRFRLQRDNVPLALGVLVPKPRVRGRIVSIEGDVIILRGKEREHRVIVTEQTKYGSKRYEGTYADLRIGYGAVAIGYVEGDELIADFVRFRPGGAKGTVIATDGELITVKTVKQLNIDCVGSDATAVLIRPRVGPNTQGTLADVQVGMPVNIGFHPNRDGQMNGQPSGPVSLLWIDVLTGL